MIRCIRRFLLSAVLALAAMTAAAPAKADPYWTNHWNWYNGTYRPYYSRHYYGPSVGGYYGNGYYGNGYAAPNYGNGYYYGPTYYGPYYGGGVSIGPLRFGWW